ncbi:MAG: PAS domain S-box protein [Bacteroidetes bacterium]|nr:PAS domain S-box protein [Bacteroidota bacterium]
MIQRGNCIFIQTSKAHLRNEIAGAFSDRRSEELVWMDDVRQPDDHGLNGSIGLLIYELPENAESVPDILSTLPEKIQGQSIPVLFLGNAFPSDIHHIPHEQKALIDFLSTPINRDHLLFKAEQMMARAAARNEAVSPNKEPQTSEVKKTEQYLRIQHDLEYTAWFQGGLVKSLAFIMNKIMGIDWIDGGGIYLLNHTGNQLELMHHVGLPAGFIKKVKVYDRRSKQFQLVLKEKPHYTLYSELKQSLLSPTGNENFKLTAVLPLVHEKQVIGSLNIVSFSVITISAIDQTAIESIAAKLGSVIAYIQSREELEESKKLLEVKVRERTQSLEQTNQELTREIEVHQKTREALNLSENLYRSIFNNAQDGILLYRVHDRKLIDLNKKIHESLGYTRKEFLKLNPDDFMIFRSPGAYERIYKQVIQKRQVIRNMQVRTKTGQIKYSLMNASTTRINETDYLLIIFHDKTELEVATQELSRTEKKMKELQNNLPIGIFTSKPTGEILYANKTIAQLLGFEDANELISMNARDFYADPSMRDKLLQILARDGMIDGFEHQVLRRGGEPFWAKISIQPVFDQDHNPLQFDGVLEDISSRKRSEHELEKANKKIQSINENLEKEIEKALRKHDEQQHKLIQKSKLESLGELAAGIAHEINQPLGIMSLSLENLQMKMMSGKSSGEYLQQKFASLEKNIDRIRQIIDHIRIFSRDQEMPTLDKVNINKVIRKALSFIETQYRNHFIEIRLDLKEDIGFTVGSNIKLEQAILNLLSNAKYAVEEKAALTDDSNYQRIIELKTYRQNESVCFIIRDNGVGISPANRSRIFDPFFTTKPEGYGTGLGLSIVYGIIKEMHGEISVESEVDQFTEMQIKFARFPENT